MASFAPSPGAGGHIHIWIRTKCVSFQLNMGPNHIYLASRPGCLPLF